MTADDPFDFTGWAILELLGHRKLAGYVREVEIFGKKMIRVDMPDDAPQGWSFTQFYSPNALYCISPVSEYVARAAARRFMTPPIHAFELPALPPARDYKPRNDDDDIPFDLNFDDKFTETERDGA